MGFKVVSMVFHGFWLVSMVFQGGFMVFHGIWLVSRVFVEEEIISRMFFGNILERFQKFGQGPPPPSLTPSLTVIWLFFRTA